MVTLYKRSSNNKPLIWRGWESEKADFINIEYGLVGGKLHMERIPITLKNANELQSRVNAKRKEGYKTLEELKDNSPSKVTSSIYPIASDGTLLEEYLLSYLYTYLPKYSTTEEGFILPMLAKVLEDNKPFNKYGTMLGQWKIDGLRCIIGAEEVRGDLFKPYKLTYHSRTGEDWTNKMFWMDDIILPKISKELLSMMIEECACLDGELYLPGYSVNDIDSFVKNTSLPQHYKLQYWCYDICCENMSAEARDKFRINNINVHRYSFDTKEHHLNNKEQLIILETATVENINDALFFRDKFINCGFEGLILRNPSSEYQFGKRNRAMFKFKKVDDGKFIIVDINSEHKRSDLPLFVCRNDINDELFECSINKPQEEQRAIFANKDKYIGKYMHIEFRARSGVNRVPFHARGIYIVNN